MRDPPLILINNINFMLWKYIPVYGHTDRIVHRQVTTKQQLISRLVSIPQYGTASAGCPESECNSTGVSVSLVGPVRPKLPPPKTVTNSHNSPQRGVVRPGDCLENRYLYINSYGVRLIRPQRVCLTQQRGTYRECQ